MHAVMEEPAMNASKTWRKCKIKCPENMGDAELFGEWCIEKEGEVLKSLTQLSGFVEKLKVLVFKIRREFKATSIAT